MELPSNDMDEDATPEIIFFNNENELTVNYSMLGKVLNGLHSKEKVIIISIVGQPKSGRSFLANWIAKYLKFNGVNDNNSWIGNDSDILEGFKWNSDLTADMDIVGNGIRTFRQPIKLTSGYSILVLDIDLTMHTKIPNVKKDTSQYQRNYNALISLCAMISSLFICIKNGNHKSEQAAELDFKGTLETVLNQIPELKDFEIPRELIFVTNEYFPSNGANYFDEIPVANSEYVYTIELMLPNLLNKKCTRYFQGETKYIDKAKLDVTLRNLLARIEFLPINFKSFNNVIGVMNIMQNAVDITNQLLEKAEQDVGVKLATQLPAATIQSSSVCHSEPSMATATTIEPLKKPGSLIIHFSRADNFKFAFIEPDTSSSKFVLKSGGNKTKVIEFLDGEFVLHKNHQPNMLDLRMFKPGAVKTFDFNNDGRDVTFCYEEAFGLAMAKIRSYFEEITVDSKKSKINTCVVIIPVLTSIIERQAIYDSAKCAGFQMIQLVSETTSVAAAYLAPDSIRKPDIKNLMVAFLSHEKLELVVQTISNKQPYITTESISGSLFKKCLFSVVDKFVPFLRTDDERYFHDAMSLSRVNEDELCGIIIAGDCASANRRLFGGEFSRLNREMDFVESTLNGAIQLTLINLNKGIDWNSLFAECIPFEIVLRTVYDYDQTLFKRCTALPANAMAKIKIDKQYKISFDIIQRIGKDDTILANYYVSIDGDAKWNILEVKVELDYCGLMKVSGKLTNTISNVNKSREVIMQKNYTSNLAPDKLPAVQQKINNWLKLGEERKLRLKLHEMLCSYVANTKSELENLDNSIKEIFWQSANALNDLLSHSSIYSKQLVKDQLSIISRIHSLLCYEVDEMELSNMNKLIDE